MAYKMGRAGKNYRVIFFLLHMIKIHNVEHLFVLECEWNFKSLDYKKLKSENYYLYLN